MEFDGEAAVWGDAGGCAQGQGIGRFKRSTGEVGAKGVIVGALEPQDAVAAFDQPTVCNLGGDAKIGAGVGYAECVGETSQVNATGIGQAAFAGEGCVGAGGAVEKQLA